MSSRNQPRKHAQKAPHIDPASEYYLPRHWLVRPRQDPGRARVDSPPYEVDAEALSFDSQASIETLEWALDKMATPGFNLEYICRSCEEWKPTSATRPKRRGAKHPESSCHGCSFSLLNGQRDSFATTDRDAAFSWWAGTKAKIVKLEYKRRDTKSKVAKDKLRGKIEKAYKELKRAVKACKRLGFNPAIAMADAPPRTRFRHEVSYIETNCGNCASWSYDEALSKRKPRGYCWVKEDGEHTSESYWCKHHRLDESSGKPKAHRVATSPQIPG